MPNTWTDYDGKRITMTYDRVDVAEDAPDWGMQQWNITLRHGRKRMTFPYYGGGVASDPTVDDVVESLTLDAYAMSVSFEEWCKEYGHDTDSRSAERTYRQCRELGDRFARFIA